MAVVLRDGPGGLDVVLMRRAQRPKDRWSGHISLPGGFQDPADASALAAAVRETREEVGLDLGGARALGRLPSRPRAPWSRWTDFDVVPFVFAHPDDGALTPEPGEVDSVRWVPVHDLRDPAHHERFWWVFRPGKRSRLGLPMRLSRVHVGDYDVWGLTLDVLGTLWGPLDAARIQPGTASSGTETFSSPGATV